jgi:hypothetical protein
MVIDTPASEINPVIISDTLVTLTPSEPKPDSTKNVLTPAQVRFAPEEAVRQEVVLALQDKAHFTPDIVSSLFAREQEHFRKYVYRKQPTTWSDTASEKPTQLLAPVTQHDGRPYLYTMRKEGGTLSSAETTYLPEKDNLAREAFKTLSLHEKKDVLSYLVDIRYIKPQELIEDIATSEKDKSELLTHLMRKLYEQKGAYNYPRYNFAKTWEYDTIDPFVEAVIQKVQTHDLLQAIVAQPKDRLGVLGMVIGQKGVARVFQDIRTILDTKDLDPSLHAKLDLMGRQLLGNTEVPFHHSLQQFYEATHEAFKTYEAIADSITDQDVEIIQTETIPLIDSSEKVIVDDACGTGRDANRLADQTALISPDKTIDANGSKTAELAHNKIVWLVFVLFGISTIGAILNKNDRSFEILTFAWFIAAGLGILTALYYIIIKSLLRRHISYVKTGFILLLIVGVVGFGSCIFNLSLSNF